MEDDAKPSFDQLGLDPSVLPTLEGLGFEAPTPIQAAAIPALLSGRDLIARARTGSGKTAAFGLPLLDRLRGSRPGLRGLVLAPTRELALQVTEALRDLRGEDRIGVATIYGGSSYRPQLEALKAGVPIIVGTPGRLLDHLDQGRLDLSQIEMVVVDEADEMLRQGFLEDVERLLAAASGPRQVAMFSATMPNEIRRIASAALDDPQTIEVEGGSRGPVVDHIDQRWVRVPQRNKLEALLRILQAERRGTTLVFARTRQACAEVSEELARRGLSADALHGDLSQNLRERVLNRLRDKSLDLLVATDVAARGIDVNHITHVINLDMPGGAEIYAHRIGRTGRAGREGKAITLVTPREIGRFKSWMYKLKVDIEEVPPPTDAEIAARHRAAIGAALEAAAEGEAAEGASAWLEHIKEAVGWDADQVAKAALAVLAAEQGLDLADEPDARVPGWAQRRDRRDDRPPRDRGHRDRDPRDRGPRQDRGHDDRPSSDEVQLFLAIGRRAGVRPADVVGALANEVGIPGRRIGRIAIHDNKSFIGLSRDDARKVLSIASSLHVRGKDSRLTWARSGDDDRGPQRDDRGPNRRDGHARFGSGKRKQLPRKPRRG